MLTPEQRHALAGFLRASREKLSPDQAGQPTGPVTRRRTPGLRREEVAQMSGISATWYTWIEQARDVSLSATALARLANALHLNHAERAYLFELAQRRDPTPLASPLPAAPPAPLLAMLRATIAPAYLLDRFWHVQGHNPPAAHLFAPWFESGETSLLRYVFLDPSARMFIHDWENRAQRLLAEFRADTAKDTEDETFKSLVETLLRDSADFRRFRSHHAVLAREGGARQFNHPRDGLLQYEQLTLSPQAYPHHKIVILLPG